MKNLNLRDMLKQTTDNDLQPRKKPCAEDPAWSIGEVIPLISILTESTGVMEGLTDDRHVLTH